MTFVLAVRTKGSVCVVADVMVTSDVVGADAPISSIIPIKSGNKIGIPTRYNYLPPRQKIRQIGEDRYLAVAGSLDDANRITSIVRSLSPSYEHISELLARLPNTFKNKIEYLLIEAVKLDGGEHRVRIESNQQWVQIGDDEETQVITLGSGVEDFYPWLSSAEASGKLETFHAMPDHIKSFMMGTAFMSEALVNQSNSSYGLDKRWGGGMEILAMPTGKLEKLDRMLFVPVCFIDRNGKTILRQEDRLTYQFMRSEELVIIVIYEKGEGLQPVVYVIPDDRAAGDQISAIPSPPQWILMPIRDESGEHRALISAPVKLKDEQIRFVINEQGNIFLSIEDDILVKFYKKMKSGEYIYEEGL